MTPIALDALVALVPDGAELALPPDNSLAPCEFARALVRRGARGLRLIGVPVSGYATDLLIGAGAVASVQTSAMTLGEAGTAPRFAAAVAAGSLAVIDATCPAMHTMLQAAEKGVPFLPLRGLLGSDLLAHRPDWRVIDNPFAGGAFAGGAFAGGAFATGGDPIVLLPALAPEFAILHAVMADAAGNVWVGRRRELATLAHAARRVLVTVERMVPGDMLADERLAPGVISGLYVEAAAIAERGAWPIGVLDEYPTDAAHLAEYARAARSEAGFRRYCDRFVRDRRAAAE